MSRLIKYASIQGNIEDEPTRFTVLEMYLNDEYGYKQCLDDYNHIISTHSEQLEQIHQQLNQCQISECKMAHRYNNNYQRRDNQEEFDNNNDETNYKLKFYMELLDTFHFWLYHQFDAGIRVKQRVKADNKENQLEDHKSIDPYFDHEFARIRRHIKNKRDTLAMRRFENNETNKYTIKVNTAGFNLDEKKEKTFFDTLKQHLRDDGIAMNIVNAFNDFIKSEEYESDTIILDIVHHDEGSNILNYIYDEHFEEFIKEYADDLKGMIRVSFPFCFFFVTSITVVIHV